jgi:excisionase family DNA binding protein
MVTLEGMITVAEAARRLNRSIEQVRRYLREGKLRGQRIGNQWFVEEGALTAAGEDLRLEGQLALLERIRANREAILRRRGGKLLPPAALVIRELREEQMREDLP